MFYTGIRATRCAAANQCIYKRTEALVMIYYMRALG